MNEESLLSRPYPDCADTVRAQDRLWEQLRDGRLWGVEFHRPALDEIDSICFFAPEAQLVVEVNNPQADDEMLRTILHQRYRHLKSSGLRVVRFDSDEVMFNMTYVMGMIRYSIHQQGLNRIRSDS